MVLEVFLYATAAKIRPDQRRLRGGPGVACSSSNVQSGRPFWSCRYDAAADDHQHSNSQFAIQERAAAS